MQNSQLNRVQPARHGIGRWLGFALLVLVLLAVAGFWVWASTPLGPSPAALAALQSDASVEVKQSHWLVFRPTGQSPTVGFIFYPGGRVDPRSYALQARDIAAQGYLTVIVPMRLNLAVFSPNRASDVRAAFPQIRTWAVGGHSLGGAMAAKYIFDHPGVVQGLALWASYPASSNNLSTQNVAVVSVYSTEDGLATLDKIDASRPLLPPATTWVAIDSGNHAQFGSYGPQPGDNPSAISAEEQRRQTVTATVTMLAAIAKE